MTGSRGRPVNFKLHIDHIDNPEKDVWVVEWGSHYVTAHQVWCEVPLHATPVKQRQPRASLSGRGIVRVTPWLHERWIYIDPIKETQ